MKNPSDLFNVPLDAVQKQALEPVLNAARTAAETFEKVSRKNYAMLGDVLEFAVQQSRLPVEASDIADYTERQATTSAAFAEQMSERAGEYLELFQGLSAAAGKTAETAAPVARKARSKKAA